MARPAWPEHSKSARSSRQFSRFYHSINPDGVFGTRRWSLHFEAWQRGVRRCASIARIIDSRRRSFCVGGRFSSTKKPCEQKRNCARGAARTSKQETDSAVYREAPEGGSGILGDARRGDDLQRNNCPSSAKAHHLSLHSPMRWRLFSRPARCRSTG